MRDFSLDKQSEKININQSREYFEEVLSSYYNGNYRAAIVLLYSVTICDLLFKLQYLKEHFNDQKSIDILESIKQLQIANPASPTWENELINKLFEQTYFLDNSDLHHFNSLKVLRNLCAHPVLSQNFDLFRPNQETVRAHIRNIMESFLLKPPIFSRNVYGDLVQDLSQNKNLFITDLILENYLNSKYFSNFNILLEKQVFKSLWKEVFRSVNVNSQNSRDINYRCLKIFLKRNFTILSEEISLNKDFYSNIDISTIDYLIDLFNNYQALYSLIKDDAKLLITSEIDKNSELSFKAFFINNDLNAHYTFIFSQFSVQFPYAIFHVSMESITYLAEFYKQQDKRLFIKLLIELIRQINNFDTADRRIEIIIDNLSEFTLEEINELLTAINENPQVNGRRAAKPDNTRIVNFINNNFDNFDFKLYKNFEFYKQ
jgi:hypothetical protein